jgi:putative transposase
MFPDPADIPPPPTRKPLRLQRHDYSHPGPYFVTISTHDQQGTLSTVKSGVIILTAIGEIARAAWNSLPQRFQGLVLDACVIMPNHLHAILLLAPSIPAVNAKERTYSLPDIIGAFKSISTNQANLILKRRDQPIWHRSYHDHIIRNSRELRNIQLYICENPIRWQNRINALHGKPQCHRANPS